MAVKTRALMATSRIANVPSVVSNVWLGVILANHSMNWTNTALAAFSGILLYLAGNFINDWHDREWDGAHRPERALPGGLFRPGCYLTLALVLGLAGAALAWWLHPWCGGTATLILLAILLYTLFHKKTPWATVPMGLCRAGLVFLGAFSTSLSGVPILSIWLGSAALFLYICGISLSARYESMPHAPLPALAGARALLVGAGLCSLLNTGIHLSLLPYFLWLGLALTVFRKPLSRQVSALLAGIPLLDWIVILPLAPFPPPAAGWTFSLWVPPLAFLSALVLQRVTPAT